MKTGRTIMIVMNGSHVRIVSLLYSSKNSLSRRKFVLSLAHDMSGVLANEVSALERR